MSVTPEERINEIAEQLLEGVDGVDLCNWVMKEYDLSKRAAWYNIKQARTTIKEENTEQRAYHRTVAIRRYNAWIKQAEDEGNIELARKIQADMNKLLGLNEAVKVEQTKNVSLFDVARLTEGTSYTIEAPVFNQLSEGSMDAVYDEIVELLD